MLVVVEDRDLQRLAERFLDVEAEDVLAKTVDRFTRRFRHIEAKLKETNKSFENSSIEEMDRYWEEAKRLEARGNLQDER